MRSFLSVPLLHALSACGRGALELPAPPLEAVPGEGSPGRTRIRLESNFERSEGFRFGDQVVLSRVTLPNTRCSTEVRTPGGVLVEGEAARTELQTSSGRYLTLGVPGGALCLTGKVGSLAEVDERACSEWKPMELLHVTFQREANAAGTGLLVRTERDEAWRVWLAESGYDALAQTDFVVFEFEARAAPAVCSTDAQPCVVRNDCCNGRHSCKAGRCEY